jgi:mannose/fructose/N-acetylgalactosamine-specific phosphotransferase system component IID
MDPISKSTLNAFRHNVMMALALAGAVLGMALYTETLNPAQVAKRWGGVA